MKYYLTFCFAFLIAIIFSISTSLQAGEYTNIDIGFPDTIYQSVTIIDINNTGQLICRADVNSQTDYFLLTSVAGIWNADLDADGGNDLMTILTPPDSFTFQFAFGPTAINDSGQIVGTMRYFPLDFDRGFLWEDGVFTALPMQPDWSGTSGYENNWAFDINNSGQIVGAMYTNTSPFRTLEGHIWDNGTVTQFGVGFGNPRYINDNGEIVGITGTPATETSIWQNGVITNLGNLGANPTIPEGINNLGQVIGRSIIPTGGFDGFIWENGLINPIASNMRTLGEATNNKGQIIGLTNVDTIVNYNYLWLPEPDYGFEAGIHNLELLIPQAPKFELARVADINDSGIIAVSGNFGTFVKINSWLMIPVPPPTITVNSVGDAVDNNPGDGICNTGNTTAGGDPECTMRAAIMESNAQTENVIIDFNIPDDPTIQPNSALPHIEDTVFIDGNSQPGNLPVLFDGINAGASADGLVFASDAIWVEGIFIGRFDGNGIIMLIASNCKVTDCTIGFSDTMDVDYGNGFTGISLVESSYNTIGGKEIFESNRISNNVLDGISITGKSYFNVIVNNRIGRTFGGNEFGNSRNGIFIDEFADTTIVGGVDEGNFIEGNIKNGIYINGADYCSIIENQINENNENGLLLDNSSHYNDIFSNTIGRAIFNAPAGNLRNGIEITSLSDSNYIGSNNDQGNIINSNGAHGIKVFLSSYNVIEGNFLTLNDSNGIHLDFVSKHNRVITNDIGIDIDGFNGANKNFGILISGESDSNLIGGGLGIVDSSNRIANNLKGGVNIISSGSNQINGNEIISNSGPGLRLDSTSQQNVVINNKIGVDFDGLEAGNLDDGIQIKHNSDSNFIGIGNQTRNFIQFNTTGGIYIQDSDNSLLSGNIISLNKGNGLHLDSMSQHNLIIKNKIGLDSTGAAAGNEKYGIVLTNSSDSNLIGGIKTDGNTISSNLFSGILIDSSHYNQVQGNIIGLDTTGLIERANKVNGIIIDKSHWTTIGIGTDADSNLTGAGNVISSNDSSGIYIFNNSWYTWVTSNIIGRGVDTSTVLPNKWGISVFDSPNTYIGGRGFFDEYLGNYIMDNNGNGVSLITNRSTLDGNYIWFNGSGLQGGEGVYVKGYSNNIGGDSLITANSIWDNNGVGILVDTSQSGTFDDFNNIRFNSISRNLLGGIDLYPRGVNLNDSLDADDGPNAGQNKPLILTSTLTSTGQIAVTGTLSSEPNQKYLMDFYSNTDCDVQGLGQGANWIVSDTIETDNFGFATFYTMTTNFTGNLPLFITSTANSYNLFNTSEFSNCNEIVPQNPGVDLVIHKTDNLDSLLFGDTVTYEISVSNVGSDDATNVIMRDSLPAELNYISDSTTTGVSTELNGIVQCNLGTMSSGTIATILIKALSVDSGLTENIAIVSANEVDIQLLNNSSTDSTLIVTKIPTDIGDEVNILPTQFELAQNYPNPFNPSTEINFSLPTRSHVAIEIFNVLGQNVKTLLNENISAGFHSISWDGKDNSDNQVSSGIYLYRFKVGEFTETKKMIILK